MIEAIYFRCYYAFLNRNIKEAEIFFDMLKSELRKTKIKNPLHYDYLIELKKVRDSIKSGMFPSGSWVDKYTPVKVSRIHGDTFKGNQDGLVRKIHYEAKNELCTILKASEDFHLHNIEHPCGIYGAVDMVYYGTDTCYPIEIKKDEGRHDVISQISKYALHFRLHTHLKFYRRVQPVTICASYQNNVIKELKAEGVTVIQYQMIGDSVKLHEL